MNGAKGEWEIFHMDGNETNPVVYHPYTHEEKTRRRTYTNASFTLRFRTGAEVGANVTLCYTRARLLLFSSAAGTPAASDS